MAQIDPLRFERIERKIDELSEAFVIMARVEEKIVNLEQTRIESNRRQDERMTHVLIELKELRIQQIKQDKEITDNTRIVGYIRWIIGAIVAAVASAWALQFLTI